MADLSSDPSAALDSLAASLDTLDAQLAPILATKLQDLIAENEGEPLQVAKLHVMMVYLVHDLIWIYLKTSGVDPSNHPVMQELTRLEAYFDKLHSAESSAPAASTSASPAVPGIPTRDGPRFTIDKSAATRFINAAISSSKAKTDPFYTPTPAELTEAPEASEAPLPPSVHTRFDDAASKLLESSGEEDGEEDGEEEVVEVTTVGKGKGKGRAEGGKGEEGEDEEMEELSVEKLPRKKAASATGKAGGKRAKMDPFAGYDSLKGSSPKGAKAKAPDTPAGALSKHQRKKLAFKKAKVDGAGASA